MLETAAVLASYLAFALLHGADARRLPRPPRRPPPAWAMRLGALAVGALAVSLWARSHGLTEALLVMLASLSLCAALFVLLAPVIPRVVWAVAASCPVAIAALAALGGLLG
jgi:hypothetical protein